MSTLTIHTGLGTVFGFLFGDSSQHRIMRGRLSNYDRDLSQMQSTGLIDNAIVDGGVGGCVRSFNQATSRHPCSCRSLHRPIMSCRPLDAVLLELRDTLGKGSRTGRRCGGGVYLNEILTLIPGSRLVRLTCMGTMYRDRAPCLLRDSLRKPRVPSSLLHQVCPKSRGRTGSRNSGTVENWVSNQVLSKP